jgi:hypothetical protein
MRGFHSLKLESVRGGQAEPVTAAEEEEGRLLDMLMTKREGEREGEGERERRQEER